MRTVTVLAPATVANVAVGFDLLGFPLKAVGDLVTVSKWDQLGVFLEDVTGAHENLPREPSKNTATVGLLKLLEDVRPGFGFRVSLLKGIPLGSGMGGSAASAVGAIVAANTLLSNPLPKEKLLKYALMGEAVASGAAHADNITPCLFGGLTLTRSVDPVDIVSIPVPGSIYCVLVHPDLVLETKQSRSILKPDIALKDHVLQSAYLAGFIAGCFRGDLELIRRSLCDVLVEPQRAPLIPGFDAVKAAALDEGALGCSISGSGPSVFAWVDSQAAAERVQVSMVRAFQEHGIVAVDSWISPVNREGAKVISFS